MPEAVDVGSVLGDRYKVTAYVLASAAKDLVLDGVDQVLNRPVSILVASADNAAQVATSARELATGDRNGNIQVLDLGITDGGTYLVTNRAPAADMLDLIVQQEAPPEPAPYIEPFFTDTLGSEIFGRPRSTEPETYDDEYGDYEEYEDDEPPPRGRGFAGLAGLTHRFRRPGTSGEDVPGDDTSALPPVTADPAPQSSPHRVPPPPSRKPSGASSASAPEEDQERNHNGGSATDEDRRRHDDRDRRRTEGTGPAVSGLTGAAGIGAAGIAGLGAAGTAAAAAPTAPSGRPASRFPLSGRDDEAYENTGDPASNDPDENDDTSVGRKFTRVLVGVVLTIVLVVAVFAAATTLSSISGGAPVADRVESEPAAGEPASEDPATAAPATTAPPTPDAVEPVIAGITRLVPGNPGLDQSNDVNLPLITDGNPSTYWGNLVYASDTFGGLATSLALVVELEEESTISEVEISQLNGSGGSFTVLVNDEPVLEGAEQIAQGGFTGPTVTLPIPDSANGAPTGQYVIINFTQLPRLSNIQAQYPFGLRIAEIDVS